MRQRMLLLSLGAVVTLGATQAPPPQAPPDADVIRERMLQGIDPTLLSQAEQKGLYDREMYPVWREMNPFFLRGDFNGDGQLDLAFWVTEKSSGQTGVAIVHSTLDTLYLYGAGKPGPRGEGRGLEFGVDAWHILPVGSVESHPFGNIPEIGLKDGVPFRFERETLEFVQTGKSAFVCYWAKGRYWQFWTAD